MRTTCCIALAAILAMIGCGPMADDTGAPEDNRDVGGKADCPGCVSGKYDISIAVFVNGAKRSWSNSDASTVKYDDEVTLYAVVTWDGITYSDAPGYSRSIDELGLDVDFDWRLITPADDLYKLKWAELRGFARLCPVCASLTYTEISGMNDLTWKESWSLGGSSSYEVPRNPGSSPAHVDIPGHWKTVGTFRFQVTAIVDQSSVWFSSDTRVLSTPGIDELGTSRRHSVLRVSRQCGTEHPRFNRACALLGVPYVWGADDGWEWFGYDCGRLASQAHQKGWMSSVDWANQGNKIRIDGRNFWGHYTSNGEEISFGENGDVRPGDVVVAAKKPRCMKMPDAPSIDSLTAFFSDLKEDAECLNTVTRNVRHVAVLGPSNDGLLPWDDGVLSDDDGILHTAWGALAQGPMYTDLEYMLGSTNGLDIWVVRVGH